MREWVAGIVGENMATGVMLVLVTLAIVIAFVLLLAIFRGFSGGGIRGTSRSRQARLAVMDAAVVDSKRRLVLIRRDDVEHLVMIGGPSDVVVEQNIRRNMQEKPVAARPQMRPVPKPAQPAQAAPAKPAPAKAAPARVAVANPATAKPAPAPQPPAAPVQKPAPAAPAAVNAIQGTVKKVVAVAAPAVAATKVATASPPQPAPPTPAAAPAPAVSAAPPPPAPVKASVAAPEPVKVAPVEPPAPAKNQLESFEDVLAMDKGKTLVPDADDTSSSLANEMDELLSEITGGSKSTT